MEAYEFYAKPENGMLPIPDEYKNLLEDTVKVIVLEGFSREAEQKNVKRKSDMLSPITIKTNGWKFDREEANERR